MSDMEADNSVDGIAIVGMAGRFPSAKNTDELWHILRDGIETISFFTDDELLAAGVDPAIIAAPNYVKARGALRNAEFFDAAFFGHSPKVAELMDPQHRLFLECAWEALEHAGYDSEKYNKRVGVYAGESMNTYLLNNLYTHIKLVASVDSLQAAIGNDKDSLTAEVSYKLNLTGPSVTIQTASSTSLVAVHAACQSLLNYECDMALAGGVSIHFPEIAGYLYQEGGATSPDGHCRAFDAQAQGFVNGHGAGIVVLKRLEDALADNDTIHAVIKGSAVNNDGSLKVSYMAPSVEGQAAVISMAQALADVPADTISYVEAHGTGTKLGDPIEIAALTQAFRISTDKKQFCAIGSLKPNIGHLDTAAGVAGLIKTVLALKHRQIPPSLHFTAPNPQIDFANSPFYVNTRLAEWPAGSTPRRAGVSSFGMGGTNAHVVVEEAPSVAPSDEARPWQLLTLSAKTSSALETATTNLVAHLKQHPDLNLADVAYTLHVGRRSFNHRRMLVCESIEDAINALETWDPERVFTSLQEDRTRTIVFMFSGQGAQYPGMGLGLYASEPVFREQVDRCAELLKPHLGLDLRDVLYPPAKQLETAAQRLNQTDLAQPALFVLEYALAQLWTAWGVQPQAMIGHSIGEYVAACLAGVFSLEDALALVAARGRLMQRMPPGAMLAVPLPEHDIQPLLRADSARQLSLAAINGTSMCVLSGPTAAVDQIEQQLTADGITCRRLHTSHAFHSAMMDPILEPFAEQVRRVNLNPPQIPYLSNVTGTWITAADAMSPEYWARHLRQPVRFAAGLQEVLKEQHTILLEVGPGQTLSTFARQHPARTAAQVVLASIRHPRDRQPDEAFLLNTLGRLWLAGVPLDSAGLYGQERRQRIPLPTYPFERQRYWVEPLPQAPVINPSSEAARTKRELADWFYLPFWKPTLPIAVQNGSADEPSCWLVFSNGTGFDSLITQRLEQQGHDVITIQPGRQFIRLTDQAYAINPHHRDDYDALCAELRARDKAPREIVHLWSITSTERAESGCEGFEQMQDVGFYSLLFLAQALAAQGPANPAQITVVSNNMQQVAGETIFFPEKVTLLGPCKVIPQEYSHLSCRSIDIVLPEAGSWQEAQLADQLLTEVSAKPDERVVAYRDHRRWIQAFEAVRLDASAASQIKLRPGGVYLITGGLGGFGLELAEHLARSVQAKLVLIGRSGLPPRTEWADWLALHSPDDRVSHQVQKVQALEALGAEVLVISADVADEEQMRVAVAQAISRFGALHGVIHAAGLVGKEYFRPIQETGPLECEQHFKAKVYGLLVLENVLQGRRLDFCMLVSSLASVLGGLGLVAYSAANLFMDSYTYKHNQTNPLPWISVNWDAWHFGADSASKTAPEDTSAEWAITPAEGRDAFERILALGPITQVVVSTAQLQSRIDQWIKLESLQMPEASTPAERSSLYPRPDLPNAYVAPRNETEQAIADIWQEVLRIEQVGIHDNFFDLGGNSLTGIQIIGQLKQAFNVQIPTVSLYEGPTVSALAKVISPDQPDKPLYEASRSRGERRREKRRERRA